MTRKDYELIAKAIHNAASALWISRMRRGVEATAHAVAEALAEDNPRFDYDRFIRACGFDTDSEE